MKIAKLTINGLEPAWAEAVVSPRGAFYALTWGEEGRGRWQVRWPLAAREFPVQAESLRLDGEFALVDLKKVDRRNNPVFLVVKGQEDGKQLVLWKLSPGFRGGASYNVLGQARVLAEGEEAQGDAGRMGGAPRPIVLVEGPCQLTWHRTGRLYGSHPSWTAIYDGESWVVSSIEECGIDDVALNY